MKVLEKAVHIQLYAYLKNNEIITSKQFGFRPKLSTGSPKKLNHIQDILVEVEGTCIERTQSFKCLGMTFNQSMSWADHIDAISMKTNQRIGLIRRIRNLFFFFLFFFFLFFFSFLMYYFFIEFLMGILI